MPRYDRNHPALTKAEQAALAQKRAVVAGCGGLGGYIIELLGRVGVGHITAVDGDVFTDSNLNRQLLSTEANLGTSKADAAKARMAEVNSAVEVTSVREFLTEENAAIIVAGHDIAIDALDSGKARKILARAASDAGIPLVSGAISGWYGRIFILEPGQSADFLWGGGGMPMGNLAPTASCIASIEVSEAIKLLLGRRVMKNAMLEIDLLSGEWEKIDIAF